MVWEGKDAVKTGRVILGATNPLASAPGTIRGDYAIDVGRNVCHGVSEREHDNERVTVQRLTPSTPLLRPVRLGRVCQGMYKGSRPARTASMLTCTRSRPSFSTRLGSGSTARSTRSVGLYEELASFRRSR